MYKWFWFEILEYYAKTSLLCLKEIVFHLMLRNNLHQILAKDCQIISVAYNAKDCQIISVAYSCRALYNLP